MLNASTVIGNTCTRPWLPVYLPTPIHTALRNPTHSERGCPKHYHPKHYPKHAAHCNCTLAAAAATTPPPTPSAPPPGCTQTSSAETPPLAPSATASQSSRGTSHQYRPFCRSRAGSGKYLCTFSCRPLTCGHSYTKKHRVQYETRAFKYEIHGLQYCFHHF